MKKLFLLILFSISIIFYFSISASERRIMEVNDAESKVSYLGDTKTKFNYIGIAKNSRGLEAYNKNLEYVSTETLEKITFTFYGRGYDDDGNDITAIAMNLILCINDNKISRIELYVYSNLILLIDMSTYDYKLQNIGNLYLDCADSIRKLSYIIIDSIYVSGGKNYYRSDMFFIAMYHSYEENIDIDIAEPLTKNEIINNFKLKDDTDTLITNFSIIDTNYPDSDYKVGNYYILLGAINSLNEFYFLKININAYKTPIKIEVDNITTSYTKKLIISDFYDYIRISDEYKSLNITSDYFYNYKKIGTYDFIVFVEPYDDDIKYKKGTITVIDDMVPEIYDALNIELELGNVLSLDDIKNKIWLYDEIDGTIINDNINIEGYDDINFNKEGTYTINITGWDNSNNHIDLSIDIIIKRKAIEILNSFMMPKYIEQESNEPIIITPIEEEEKPIEVDNSDYVIYAYTSRKISINEVYELLIADQIIEDDSIIESSYFDSNNNAGHYELKVTNLDGSNDYYEIIVLEKDNEIIEEENYSFIWIISISLGVLIIVGLIIGMRVYAHVKKN